MYTTLLLGLALVVGAPNKETPKKEEPSVVGEWVLESMTIGGKPIPKAQQIGTTQFTFKKDGQMVVNQNGRNEEGTYTTDTKKKIYEIDLIPPAKVKEPTLAAIFKFDGEQLILCGNMPNNNLPGKRPTEFSSTAENNNTLITLKRVKKD